MSENEDFEASNAELEIEFAIDYYPTLKPLWQEIKKLKPEIKVEYYDDGLTGCTITTHSLDGKISKTYFSANTSHGAIHNAIRHSYTKITGKNAPVDPEAYFDDVEMD